VVPAKKDKKGHEIPATKKKALILPGSAACVSTLLPMKSGRMHHIVSELRSNAVFLSITASYATALWDIRRYMEQYTLNDFDAAFREVVGLPITVLKDHRMSQWAGCQGYKSLKT